MERKKRPKLTLQKKHKQLESKPKVTSLVVEDLNETNEFQNPSGQPINKKTTLVAKESDTSKSSDSASTELESTKTNEKKIAKEGGIPVHSPSRSGVRSGKSDDDEGIPTAKSLSEGSDDLTNCPLCDVLVKKSEVEVHFQKCLREKFQRKGNEDRNKEDDKKPGDEELFHCQFCHKDLSKFNSTRKAQHLNRCMDQKEREGVMPRANTKTTTEVLDCPICGKKLRTAQAKRVHMKKCATTYGVNTDQVIKLVKKQEKEGEILAAVKDPGVSKDETQSRASKTTKRKKVKEPKGKFDEEMQMALAISTSLAEAEGGALPRRPEAEYSKGGRKGKRAKQEEDPLILVFSDQQKQSRTEDNVSNLLLSQERKDQFSPDEQGLFPSKCDQQDKEGSLWHKGCLLHKEPADVDSRIQYYVGSLIPPLEPCTVVAGSKLRRMSQIPGRGRLSVVHKDRLASQEDIPTDVEIGGVSDRSLVVSTQTVVDLAELLEEGGGDGPTQGDTDRGSNLGGFCQEQTARLQNDAKTKATEKLQMDFSSLIDNPVHSDVNIVTRDGVVKAHAVILSVRCPVLSKMLCGDRIPLENESSDIVKSVLTYIYTADLDITVSQILDIKALAVRLKLDELVDACDQLALREYGSKPVSELNMDESTEEENRSLDDVFGDESDEENNKAEEDEESKKEDESLSEEEYFEIMSTQRQKLLSGQRKSETEAVRRSMGKRKYTGGDATQKEMSLFFKGESSEESDSDVECLFDNSNKMVHQEVKRRRTGEMNISEGNDKSLNKGKGDLQRLCMSSGSKNNSMENRSPNGSASSKDLGEVHEDSSSKGDETHAKLAAPHFNLDKNDASEYTRDFDKGNEESEDEEDDVMLLEEDIVYDEVKPSGESQNLDSPNSSQNISGTDLFGSPTSDATHSEDFSNQAICLDEEEDGLSSPSKKTESLSQYGDEALEHSTDLSNCEINSSSVNQRSYTALKAMQGEELDKSNTKSIHTNTWKDRLSSSGERPRSCIDTKSPSRRKGKKKSEGGSKDYDVIISDTELKFDNQAYRDNLTNDVQDEVLLMSPKFKPKEVKKFRFMRNRMKTLEGQENHGISSTQDLDVEDGKAGKSLPSPVKEVDNDVRDREGDPDLIVIESGSPEAECNTSQNTDNSGEDPRIKTMVNNELSGKDLEDVCVVSHELTQVDPANRSVGDRDPAESGELSPLEDDVWEDFEDDGMGGDVIIVNSPGEVDQSQREAVQENSVTPKAVHDDSDLPDLPEGDEGTEFSDSFVIPSIEDVFEDTGKNSKENFKTPVTTRGTRKNGIRKEQSPDKPWVPPSPFTPMPNYESMATPVLKKEVQRYGVKPIGKKKMILVLKDIYQKMHDYETDSEFDITHEDDGDTSVNKDVDMAKGSEVKDANNDDDDDGVNSSQTSVNSEASDLIEESFVQTSESDVPASQQTKGDLMEKFVDFLEKRQDIHSRILMYEPLELDWLKKEMTEAGIKTSMDKLMNFLDEKCITFTMKNRRNNSPRKKRGRKKKEEQPKE